MTKLEKKLVEIGYEKDDFPNIKIYIKRFKDLEFWVFVHENEILKKNLYFEYSGYEFDCFEKIVDEIKKDLEILKGFDLKIEQNAYLAGYLNALLDTYELNSDEYFELLEEMRYD